MWDVFIATTARAGAPNVVRLEFERRGQGQAKMRYTRPVEGSLLEALHTGASLSRAALEQELDLAIRQAGGPDEPPAA